MTLVSVALSNLLIAMFLAVPATLASLWGRRPALTHALWLLVLIKLVTPPLFEYPVVWPGSPEPVQVAQQPPVQAMPVERAPDVELPPAQPVPEWQPHFQEDIDVPAEQIPVPPIAPAPVVLPAPRAAVEPNG